MLLSLAVCHSGDARIRRVTEPREEGPLLPYILSIAALSQELYPATRSHYPGTDLSYTSVKMALDQYTYVFVIGTFFAMLDAYNNGASEC